MLCAAIDIHKHAFQALRAKALTCPQKLSPKS